MGGDIFLLRAVGQKRGQPIALLNALGCQGRSQGMAEAGDFSVGHRRALEDEEALLWALAHGLADDVEQGAVGVWLQRMRHAGVVEFKPGPVFHRPSPPGVILRYCSPR